MRNENTVTAKILYLKNTLNAMRISMRNEKTATQKIQLYLAAYYWPDEDCEYACSKGYGIIQPNGADLTVTTPHGLHLESMEFMSSMWIPLEFMGEGKAHCRIPNFFHFNCIFHFF
jgi:hypothetical protein